MALKITPIKFLRSNVFRKRPDPAKLLEGQPALNTNSDEPGLFFRDSEGNLFKVGPCSIGMTAPNAGATGPGSGNTPGELWVDLDETMGATLKVWDGSAWIPAMPPQYGMAVISETAPPVANYLDGTMWWNSANGLMYVKFTSNNVGRWIQVSSSISLPNS